MRRAALVLIIVVTGCWTRASDEPAADEPAVDEPTQAKASPKQEPALAADGGTKQDPSFAVMQKVCASDCSGRFASVTVFRDEAGKAVKLRFDGDHEVCSHPPRIYYDGEGRETLTVAEKPVVPGSPEAESIAAKQAAEVEGLNADEMLSCFDPSRCEADRIPDNTRSNYECRSDSDCVSCECAPVNRDEWTRRGGAETCNVPGEECRATNPACCDGRCVLAY